MTKDNEDALRCAGDMDQFLLTVPAHPLCTDATAHLRRLVRENEALRSANAALALACRSWKAENEAKDALLRQAVEALEEARTFVGAWPAGAATIAAIRQHLES